MVVHFGYRRGALVAARKAGLDVIQIVETAPSKPRRGVVRTIETSSVEAAATWEAVASELREAAPAAVFALKEGMVLAAAELRDALGLSRGDAEVARRCTDKALMKRAVRAAGLRCAAFVEGDGDVRGERLAQELGLPLFVKPRIGWGGREARRVTDSDELGFVLDPGWMAERQVDGTEMSVEAIVQNGEPVFVNFTEYLEPGWSNVVPARLGQVEERAVRALLRGALDALGVHHGFVHLELFLTADGPVFSELAWRPPGGRIMELIELAYGFDPWEAWQRAGCDLPFRVESRPRAVAGVRLFHPGPGLLKKIDGIETLSALAGAHTVRFKAQPGERIAPRSGVGQEVGYVLLTGSRRNEVAEGIHSAREAVRFELDP